MRDFICNTCGEYINEECICSEELKDYDYDIYAGGNIEWSDWGY